MSRIFLFLIGFTFSVQAQNFDDIAKVVGAFPNFKKPEDLAQKIDEDFDTELDKVKASFYWLTSNFRYNLKEFYNPKQRSFSFRYSSEAEKQQKLQALKDELVSKAFRTKMGVCEEYAQSFKKLCDLLNIEAYVIKGYVRTNTAEIGVIPRRTNHAWNAVKIKDRYIILDATWAAGYEFQNRWLRDFNEYYFDIPANNIFKTHFPEDKIWVLRFGRINKEQFYGQPIYSNTFFGTGAKLLKPTTGILRSSKDNFKIILKDLPVSTRIAYSMKGMRFIQKPTIKRENGVTTLGIVNPKRKSELIIYFDQRDALHFKIR